MVYGATKLEGERQAGRWFKSYTVRAGWMVGLDREHKFVSLIVKQLAAGARTIYAEDDKFGTRLMRRILRATSCGWRTPVGSVRTT